MNLEVKEFNPGRIPAEFLRLPFDVYRSDDRWVAPLASEVRRTLNTRKNPYFSAGVSLRLFVACRNGRPTARLAVVVNPRHAESFGTKTAFFGFFEAFDDEAAVRTLFDRAERFARETGADEIEGPFNPHHYSEAGILADRFDALPAFFQPYNPPYYPALLEKAGLAVSRRMMTMRNDDIRGYLRRRFGPDFRPADRPGFVVRPLRRHDLRAELERIREVNNDAFAENWPFLPLSAEEYRFAARHLSAVTEPDFIQIAEFRGRPVGVLHCVLDINPLLRPLRGRFSPAGMIRFQRGRRRIKTILIYTVAIRKAFRRTRVYHDLLAGFCRVARRFEAAETTWISPDNTAAVGAAESLGMVPDKHFVLFRKTLQGGIQ